MDIVELMQKALDKTDDPDALFALDRGITEIERLRTVLKKIVDKNAFNNHGGLPMDSQYYAQMCVEMVNLAGDALKGKE